MGLSVGALNVSINASLLLVLAFGQRLLLDAIQNFAAVESVRRGRVVDFREIDLFVYRLPKSFAKHRRNRGILSALVTSVLLLSGEVLTEVGLSSSARCTPKLVSRPSNQTICARDFQGNSTDVEQYAAAQDSWMRWRDEMFVFVQQGFPKLPTGRECLECWQDNVQPIVNRCSVELVDTVDANNATIAVSTTAKSFGTIVTGISIGKGGTQIR
eukprot:Plantae.Rhodophyta-Rhodochaete_pulchella.ctg32595.p2 GENE.Plantae.Rhodophyta-Rhodochaete_pulchella.ctg32595~~Plantae.Rhodophyta-Rhodochaete_pulchella.ctg32595.p2  ORF type:complete len:214 (+),score=18.35 Plantae.Rhodophyta-Rhodochaete_pulchella.ctg32595:452-1093(+)